MRIEIGAGEHPHPEYDVHVDVLPLPGISHVAMMHDLPFPDLVCTGLRAADVLEHQSYELVSATLREWARVMIPGAGAYIQVPNARSLAQRWVSGELNTDEADRYPYVQAYLPYNRLADGTVHDW